MSDNDRARDDARLAARRERTSALGQNIRLFPRPGPKLYAGAVWWALGLYVLFVARAPYTPTPMEEQTYSELMQQAIFSEDMREAQQDRMAAQRKLDEVHVWGWRWRAPYNELVPPRQQNVDVAESRLRAALRERDALVSDAKASVGLWSSYGVDEVRERFWKAYQEGKDFAKRMTFWDVMLGAGGRNRDEELLGTMLRWAGQIMMNFTVGARHHVLARAPAPFDAARPPCSLRLCAACVPAGLFSALISFMFSLVSMIWEYKTSYLSGLLFFFVAMSGASAMVATFVGGMYATAAGGFYALIQSSARHARLEGGRQARNPRMRYDQGQAYQGGGYGARQPRYEHYD